MAQHETIDLIKRENTFLKEQLDKAMSENIDHLKRRFEEMERRYERSKKETALFWEMFNDMQEARKIIDTLKTENSELKHQIDKLQLENKLIKKYKK